MSTATKKRPIERPLPEELEARSDCRYGLGGVRVRIRDHPGEYIIYTTWWGAGQALELAAYPADGPAPKPGPCDCRMGDLNGEGKPFEIHTALCTRWDLEYPPGMLHRVKASDCTLTSRWPVVCCRPRRRRKATAPWGCDSSRTKTNARR